MLKKFTRAALLNTLRGVSKLPVSRHVMHRMAVGARGNSVVFFRCRRLLPDTHMGRSHIGRKLHNVLLPDEFDGLLGKLQRELRFVHMGEALNLLSDGDRLNESIAVLTFDESFATTAELALPILQKRALPATFFVTTGHLDGSSTLWDQCVHHVVQSHDPEVIRLPWADQVMRTDSLSARRRSVRHLLISLASLDETRLYDRLSALFDRTGGVPKLPALDRMLTDIEITALAEHSLVSIAAHGHRHLALASISDEALLHELEKPREILRDLAGSSFVDVVSYPFGRAPYVDERAQERARALGIRAGFGSHSGVMRPGDHMFRIPRLALDNSKSQMTGAYELVGLNRAVDEALLMATGASAEHLADIEG